MYLQNTDLYTVQKQTYSVFVSLKFYGGATRKKSEDFSGGAVVAKKEKEENGWRNPAAENEGRLVHRAATASQPAGLCHPHNLARKPEIGVFFFF